MEVLLLSEQDARLRAHRPRAGRIEAEVCAARSAELLSQRRRHHARVKAVEAAVARAQDQVDVAVLALRADAAAWRDKLLGYEGLLGDALSSKGIDICWRQAQAAKGKADKQLQQRLQVLGQLVASCGEAVVAASTQLREAGHAPSPQTAEGAPPLADGGLSTLEATTALLLSHEEQAALAAELGDALAAALSHVEQLLPAFKQDMALVELLATHVDGARKRVAAELARNAKAGERISVLLQQLEQGVSRHTEAAPVGAQGDAMADCQGLLACVDQLRQALLRQGQALLVLRSTLMPAQAVDLSLPTELLQLGSAPAQDAGGSGSGSSSGGGGGAGGSGGSGKAAQPAAAAPSSSSRATTPKKAAGRPAAGSKGAERPGSPASKQRQAAAAAALASAAGQGSRPGSAGGSGGVVPLVQHVSAIMDGAKQEVTAAAKAYFAAKVCWWAGVYVGLQHTQAIISPGCPRLTAAVWNCLQEAGRPIRYPSKVPDSLQGLSASVEGVFESLQAALQEHVATSTRAFRVQVRDLHPAPRWRVTRRLLSCAHAPRGWAQQDGPSCPCAAGGVRLQAAGAAATHRGVPAAAAPVRSSSRAAAVAPCRLPAAAARAGAAAGAAQAAAAPQHAAHRQVRPPGAKGV